MIAILYLVLGFIVLVKGADYLVDGASALALKIKVPQIVIGLTIVAFGTSLPELIVNIFASLGGQNDIAFGNVVGSNLFNLLFILGLSALVFPLEVKKNTVKYEIPFAVLTTIILYCLVNDKLLFGKPENMLGLLDALVLLFLFIVFLCYNNRLINENTTTIDKNTQFTWQKIIYYLVLGLAGLIIGGKIVVDNSVLIAQYLGISKKVIGLTIVAIGTSLPELMTSVVAAYKKNPDIAIGNILGSNIFNICFILGISGLIRPIVYQGSFNIEICLLVISTLVMYLFMFIGKKRNLSKGKGIIFLIFYISYILYLLLNTK